MSIFRVSDWAVTYSGVGDCWQEQLSPFSPPPAQQQVNEAWLGVRRQKKNLTWDPMRLGMAILLFISSG